MVKAFVQQARCKPGLILPAKAVNAINDATGRPSAVQPAAKPAAKPAVTTGAASGATATLTVERAEPTVAEPTVAEPTATEPDDLMVLPGVGRTVEARLRQHGFDSYAALADADAAVLNEIPGAKGRGDRWIRQARALRGV